VTNVGVRMMAASAVVVRNVMARDDPVESGRVMSSLLAQSQHHDRADACLLSG